VPDAPDICDVSDSGILGIASVTVRIVSLCLSYKNPSRFLHFLHSFVKLLCLPQNARLQDDQGNLADCFRDYRVRVRQVDV
jgi:hypothetical protein